MNTKKVIGMLLLAVFCTVCFTGNAQQALPDKLDVSIIVDCKNPHLKIMIENIVNRELGKLQDVNLLVETPGKFILNIVAVESGCDACGRISITSLFLTRQSPTPRFMIDDQYLKAYEQWNNIHPSFGIPIIQSGYCSRDRLEEYFIGTSDDFNKRVLETDRLAKQFASGLLDNLRGMEKALENNQ